MLWTQVIDNQCNTADTPSGRDAGSQKSKLIGDRFRTVDVRGGEKRQPPEQPQQVGIDPDGWLV
ncbi:MAG: hypothetical protein WCR20_01925 [Verrucomicrobiota bacterium]